MNMQVAKKDLICHFGIRPKRLDFMRNGVIPIDDDCFGHRLADLRASGLGLARARGSERDQEQRATEGSEDKILARIRIRFHEGSQ